MTTILPQTTRKALEAITMISNDLVDAIEHETNMVAMNEGMSFVEASKVKTFRNGVYQKAAKEFMARQDEFKAHGGDLLEKCIDAQKRLGEVAKINFEILEPMTRKDEKQAPIATDTNIAKEG